MKKLSKGEIIFDEIEAAIADPADHDAAVHAEIAQFHGERLAQRLAHVTFTLYPYWRRYGIWPDRDPVLIESPKRRPVSSGGFL